MKFGIFSQDLSSDASFFEHRSASRIYITSTIEHIRVYANAKFSQQFRGLLQLVIIRK